MNNNSTTEYKAVILSRYCGKYRPADEKTATALKTSSDIMLDLRPMAEFTPDEISAYLATMGYSIGFDGETPVWLLKTDDLKQIE